MRERTQLKERKMKDEIKKNIFDIVIKLNSTNQL